MIISAERLISLAHQVTDGVWQDDIADYKDEDQALKITKKAIQDFINEELEIDKKAREKVTSLKRGVVEGSPEWDIMYKKYYEEERGKRDKR